ncbi:MAG: polysaccharide pyruvyl transferase family protein [Rhodobacteraceae bacterium]|nr:polysaccharide pyruvyl transferase family protein [Paracoccaceae bacterium]
MKVILGAAPDTGNQGVSALCFSAVDGLAKRDIGPIAVANHSRDARAETWHFDGQPRDVTLFRLSHTRRYWRGDCLTTVKTLVPFGGLMSVSARIIAQSEVVMDVSGGDSFTDLYGPKRFASMTRQKLMALENGKPLILLPQTLGPFRDQANKALAADILRRCAAVFVRDDIAFGVLKDMLGDQFDPKRHFKGPDMAVLLPQSEPSELPETVTRWLAERDTHPVAGLNVSGLLCQDPEAARKTYGLADLHTSQIDAAAKVLLDSDPAMRLLLVSHVLRAPDDPESDWAAAMALQDRLGPEMAERVTVLPQRLNATELKWLIAQLDWFAGARMHATIAGLSSGVPTLGFGYSHKAEGVFSECGIGADVADLRELDADGVAAKVAQSVAQREDMKLALAEILPGIKKRASDQMDALASIIRSLGG